MRQLIGVLSLLSTVGCAPPPPPTDPSAALIAYALRDQPAAERYTALVETACNPDPFVEVDGHPQMQQLVTTGHLGSAVLIDDRHAITAYHVVDCQETPIVRLVLPSGRRLRAQVDRADLELDIARLTVAADERLSTPRPVVGSAAVGNTACASVAEPERRWICGAVQSADSYRDGIQFSATVVPGNSGGGVYVGGRLVGIVTKWIRCAISEASCGGLATPLEGVHPEWFGS